MFKGLRLGVIGKVQDSIYHPGMNHCKLLLLVLTISTVVQLCYRSVHIEKVKCLVSGQTLLPPQTTLCVMCGLMPVGLDQLLYRVPE